MELRVDISGRMSNCHWGHCSRKRVDHSVARRQHSVEGGGDAVQINSGSGPT